MLLLLLAPLALVSAAPGSSKCTWGPAYWCANLPQVSYKSFSFRFLFPYFPQASECSAVKHCIKAVWEKETVPQDDDEVEITIKIEAPALVILKTVQVCKICKEMVGEARDTLMSNETQVPQLQPQHNVYPCKLKQEELREVFDGSCDLIPVGLIAKECKALVEQFVPELVETLASEMNPDT